MTGVELIAAERQRQIDVEGWSSEHDDEHDQGEMIDAGICYAGMAACLVSDNYSDVEAREILLETWPWDMEWWKPSDDTIRNLVKSAALLASEIDRLQRKAKMEEVDNAILAAVQRDKVREAHRTLEEAGESHVPNDK